MGTVATGRGGSIKRCCPMVLLLRLLLQVVVATASGVSRTAVFSFESTLHDLVEGHNRTLPLAISVPPAEFAAERGPWVLSMKSIHDDIAEVDEPVRRLSKDDFDYDNTTRFYTLDTSFTVHGRFLGKTGVRMRLVAADEWDEVEQEEQWKEQSLTSQDARSLDVWVRRSPDSVWLTSVFVATLIVLISMANVMMGCELDLKMVCDTVRRPVGPVIGFFTQFLVMPLLAYVIAQVVFVSKGYHSFALGLFVTGCSPGGGASNFWTILLDGNVNLSITMTFISTLASLVMMPMWVSVLGRDFLQGYSSETRIAVPHAKIARSLLGLVIPLMIGVAIARWKPTWAAKCRKVMRPFIVFVLVFVIGFGCIANSYMWRVMTWNAMLGGLLLPWCGFMFGCFTSIILRRSPADVTAIAIETGIQNTGIAIFVLKFSFSEPDADMSALLPVIVACFTPGPLLAGYAVHTVYKAIENRRKGGHVQSDAKEAGLPSLDQPALPLVDKKALAAAETAEAIA